MCFAVLLAFAAGLALPAHAGRSPYDWALIELDYVRDEKAERLRNFCARMKLLANDAAEDAFVRAFFRLSLEGDRAREKGSLPQKLVEQEAELSKEFDSHYIARYFAFYDMLFISPGGKVFYTVRRESDYHEDLLSGAASNQLLSQCIAERPKTPAFVDFHHYAPSQEPAAFFVEPMYDDEGSFLGWLALQCAINKVNSLFATAGELGRTGETFLVNREGYMLTESYFVGASTILEEHLDDRNIEAKFGAGKGHRTVTDYRGSIALSSFEVMEFMDTKWLAVAKIDKAEVTTCHYAAHCRYFADKLVSHIKNAPAAPLSKCPEVRSFSVLRVDMDEFLRAGSEEAIETRGISTCTALLAALPKRFAYLAHLTPKDLVYGGKETNLVGQLMKRLKSFDIYPAEQQNLVFVVAAPHLNALGPILDALIAEGILLNQIRVAYLPGAERAAVHYSCPKERLTVQWDMTKDHEGGCCQSLEATLPVEPIIERIIDAHSHARAHPASMD